MGKCLKPLPIGIEDFEEMIMNEYYYIDKTLLIKDLLDNRTKVSLFTRPRRFGKTLNISMIQCFFEKKDDKEDRSYLFNELKIMKAGEKYINHMNQYPVINLSLKGAAQSDFQSSFLKMKEILIREFKRHRYLMENNKMEVESKELYKSFLQETVDMIKYSGSLLFLSECLAKAYEKKVIILIDEYDVPLENAFFKGFYNEMIDFIRSLLGDALKTNPFLEFAVLTGCLRISKESIFTGLNNLDIISITSMHYGEYFGFTEQEVEATLKEYHLEDKIDTVKNWYNGYLFGKMNVYNSWSFIKYVRDAKENENCYPAPYWSNTSSNNIIRTLINKAGVEAKEEIEQLIQGGTITKQIHEDITYDDIESSMENLWNFLFFTGYLKKVSSEFKSRVMYLKLKIPNEEVRYIYERKIEEWMNETIRNRKHQILYENILKGDAEGFQNELNVLLGDAISYMDSKENFYHGFLMGLLLPMEHYKVKSNRESGNGRRDIFLSCVINRDLAVVMELKVANSYLEIDKCCDTALRQIDEMNYEAELKEEGYQNIFKYGIAFFRKNCKIKYGNE